MAINRGKDFEEVVKESFKSKNIMIDRIPDQMNGYSGSSNISDFIVYDRPTLMYLECKSSNRNVLSFQLITKNQWDGMLNKKRAVDGVVAGVMMWFVEQDTTIWVDIEALESMKADGNVSFNLNKLLTNFENHYPETYYGWQYNGYPIIRINGEKKRVFFDYDMKEFMHSIHNIDD